MHDGNLSRKYFLVSAYFLRSAAFFVSRGGLDFRCLFAPGASGQQPDTGLTSFTIRGMRGPRQDEDS